MIDYKKILQASYQSVAGTIVSSVGISVISSILSKKVTRQNSGFIVPMIFIAKTLTAGALSNIGSTVSSILYNYNSTDFTDFNNILNIPSNFQTLSSAYGSTLGATVGTAGSSILGDFNGAVFNLFSKTLGKSVGKSTGKSTIKLFSENNNTNSLLFNIYNNTEISNALAGNIAAKMGDNLIKLAIPNRYAFVQKWAGEAVSTVFKETANSMFDWFTKSFEVKVKPKAKPKMLANNTQDKILVKNNINILIFNEITPIHNATTKYYNITKTNETCSL